MGGFVIIFILVAIAIIGIAVATANANAEAVSAVSKHLVEKFDIHEIFVSPIDKAAIGLNFETRKLVLAADEFEGEYDFGQISSVELVQNGATLSQSNRGSQLAGAAVGGLLFGGVGAVVGGLSGSSVSRDRVRSIELKVTVDDRRHPVQTIRFLKQPDPKGLDPDHVLVTQAKAQAERCHAHVVNALRQAQAPALAPAATQPVRADELQKLWDLKEAGALTLEEFNTAKARLLGGSHAETPRPSVERGQSTDSEFASVSLASAGSRKINVIKVLRELRPDLELKQALKLVEGAPSMVLPRVPNAEARLIRARLAAEGASVVIQPVS